MVILRPTRGRMYYFICTWKEAWREEFALVELSYCDCTIVFIALTPLANPSSSRSMTKAKDIKNV